MQTVAASNDVVLEVYVDDIAAPQGLGAYEFTLTVDPALLSYADFANGPFLGSTGRSVTCLPPWFGNIPGVIRFGCITSGPPAPSGTNGPTGSGLLATVYLATSCAGSTAILLESTLGTPLGSEIPAVTEDASATVDASPCPTPAPDFDCGDANKNGVVDAVDAALILQYSAGLTSSINTSTADVDDSGTVNAIDAALILQLVAGLVEGNALAC
jgi:hypothetical protein